MRPPATPPDTAFTVSHRSRGSDLAGSATGTRYQLPFFMGVADCGRERLKLTPSGLIADAGRGGRILVAGLRLSGAPLDERLAGRQRNVGHALALPELAQYLHGARDHLGPGDVGCS